MRASRWAVAAVVVGLVAYVALAWSFWFVCDDAFISFRYARNWAHGMGVRFNPGEHTPVEGYSNFLWVAIAAVVELVRASPATVMPALSILSGVAFALYGWRSSQDRYGLGPLAGVVVAATLLFAPGFVVWSTSGLATLPAAFLLYVTFDRWVASDDPRDARLGGLTGLLLALLRTEGIAWVVVLAVLGAFVRLTDRWGGRVDRARAGEAMGALVRAVAVVVVGYAVYFTWRFTYYDSLLANTAYAKVDFGWERIQRGLDYLAGFWSEALAPPIQMLGVLAAWRIGRWRGLMVGAMAVAAPLYAVLIGGDFMTMGRMVVPGLVFTALLAGFAVEALGRMARPAGWVAALVAFGLVGLGSLPLADVQLVDKDVRKQFRVRWNTSTFRSEYGQWRFMKGNANLWSTIGEALDQTAQPGESIVLGAIGAIAYHCDLFVYDRYGLVTREVAMREGGAHRKVSPGHDKAVAPTFFLDQEPTYLDAQVYRDRGVAKRAVRSALQWRSAAIRADYGPEITHVDLDGESWFLVTIKRMDDPGPAWEQFDTRVKQVLRDEDSPHADRGSDADDGDDDEASDTDG